MSKMIQVRNVPEPIHRKLKARAAEQGVSLSDFILAELKRVSEQISPRELAARAIAIAQAAERDGKRSPTYSVVDALRDAREERENHLASLFASEGNEPRPRGKKR